MHHKALHPWNVTWKQAIEIQESLCSRLVSQRIRRAIKYVAGTDLSCSRRNKTAWAGAVVLTYPGLQQVDARGIRGTLEFPYVPGLLSFREIPLLLKVLEDLRCEPDVILCDGQGTAHPRGMGLASHLGILTGKPTIGCAKSRLVGSHAQIGHERGRYSPLVYEGKTVGAALRTRTDINPVFVSPGSGITLAQSIEIILHCSGRYRIPEPVRLAHLLVNRLRRQEEAR